MIVTQQLEIKLNQFKSHHYKRLGYDTDGKESIMVDIKDIGRRTPVKIGVKCDICGREKTISYRKYTDNISKYNIYTCSNKCAMFKNEMTNLEKYGDKHQCRNKKVQDKILSTKLDRGLISNSFQDFLDYRRIVNNITNRNKKILYKNWNGFDYYEGDYIKENLSLNFNDVNYPTIDHKISAMEGYNNGIPPEEIAKMENLCITRRRNNSSKGFKTEEIYIKQKTQS